MQRRTLLLGLVLAGIIVIAAIVYWLVRSTPPSVIALPPPTTNTQTAPTPNNTIAAPTPTDAVVPVQAVPANEDRLKRFSMDFVSRSGSYTNTDDFLALERVSVQVSPALGAFLRSERTRLQTEHPSAQGAWTQTMRGLSARITAGLPLDQSQTASVSVQARRVIEDGAKPAVIEYREVQLQMTKDQYGEWVVTRIEEAPLEL